MTIVECRVKKKINRENGEIENSDVIQPPEVNIMKNNFKNKKKHRTPDPFIMLILRPKLQLHVHTCDIERINTDDTIH